MSDEQLDIVMRGRREQIEYQAQVTWDKALTLLQQKTDDKLPKCGMCGGVLSKNPHPKAGKPPDYSVVGTKYVCIPCTVKSRHNWAERAMDLEQKIEEMKLYYQTRLLEAREDVARQEREKIIEWGEEECSGHGIYKYSIKRRQCYNCWQALKGDKEKE